VDDALVGLWKFDDGANRTATDSSGNGNDGVLMEYVEPAWGEGRTSGALEFDGFTQWVRVPNSPSLDSIQIANQVSIAAWVYRTPQLNQWSGIASQQYETAEHEHYQLTFFEGALTILISSEQEQHVLCTDPDPAPFDQWIHVAGTFDGTTLRAYMDGVEVCALTHPLVMSPEDTPLVIGGNSNFATDDAQELLAGSIDELALYARALSAAEIASLAGVD
jgi:hypothetical protein